MKAGISRDGCGQDALGQPTKKFEAQSQTIFQNKEDFRRRAGHLGARRFIAAFGLRRSRWRAPRALRAPAESGGESPHSKVPAPQFTHALTSPVISERWYDNPCRPFRALSFFRVIPRAALVPRLPWAGLCRAFGPQTCRRFKVLERLCPRPAATRGSD